ncbi:MAG TPA: aminopeptidase N [Streptosporangiaceae bacterium]|nr:aminopeptidase N [Streptosporangiaceae bacterium]
MAAAQMLATGCTEAEAKARAALLEVETYTVSLDLATDPGVIRSSSQIRFRCSEPGSATFADLRAAAVHRVCCNGEELDPAVAVSAGRLHLDRLTEQNLLTVDAEFRYAPDGRGLARFTDPAGGEAYLLASCYPANAPNVFCCFDQPDLRADFTLTVTAPAGWQCVANGAVTERPSPGEAGIWRFAAVPLMKPYDLALCAGPYVTAAEEEYGGTGGAVRLSVRCRPTLANSAGAAGLGRVCGLVSRALAWYERALGVACPYPKYDIVFAPELGAAAVCIPGVMAVSETMLHRLADPEDDFAAMVLAHEVAHLWFGSLVAERWWDDVWLAEALATYLSYTALEETLGTDSPWRAFCMREQEAAYRADTLPSTEPVSSPVPDAADALARPAAITYSKGASAIRQLAALIGGDALRAGLRDYVTRYGGAAAALGDLVACWSAASGRDLAGWAEQWLRTSGVNTLRPQLALAPDGGLRSLTVVQTPPADGTVLREHRVAIGVYDAEGGRLRRRQVTTATLTGARTAVPELAGIPAPAALVLNDGDLTFARIRFDPGSLRRLLACGLDMDDPLTEAVCWNAFWDMTTCAEMAVAEFTGLVARRIRGGSPPAGVAELLEHVRTGADYYAVPADRPGLREQAAAAALEGARRAEPGSRAQRALAVGFAAVAHGDEQLGLLRRWLDGTALPDGVDAGTELRGQVLATLSASGLAADDDLDAFAATDPAGGAALRATCRALRPDPAAKDAAWTAALDRSQSRRMALAHARGIWAPGQERILEPYRDRYFAEVLPGISGRETIAAAWLARLLYPATLAGPETIAATDAALSRGGLAAPLRKALLEQRAILLEVLAARSKTRHP